MLFLCVAQNYVQILFEYTQKVVEPFPGIQLWTKTNDFRDKSMHTTEQKHEYVTNNRFPFSNVFTLLNRDWQ